MFLMGAQRVLWGLSLIFVVVQCRTIDFGGYVTDTKILDSTESLYEIRKDIIIEKDASLIIKPGVELRFAPGVGIYVQGDGTLDARGTKYQKIVFTRLLERQPWSKPEEYEPSGWPGVRLVDGDSIVEGRLQILYGGKWRSVCTNSKNWTEEALSVTCRQLGFSGGRLNHWFPRSNDSSQLLYEDPHCEGNESSLFHCPNWPDRQLGGGVCDYHYDIGIHCDRHLGTHSSSNWKGIKFTYAKNKVRKPVENKVNRLVSFSALEHVTIIYAGRDAYGNATPALEIIGLPPVIDNVEVKHSAFDAVQIYYPSDSFTLKDSIISNNRGHGVFVNSSVSLVTLSGVTIKENGGNGVHFVHHESFGSAAPFCDSGSLGSEQNYPVRRSHTQHRNQYSKNCEQVFEVASRTGQVLTVNFMGFLSDFSDPKYASRIEVYDGMTSSNRLLASIPVVNNTYPQSITSSREKIFLKYRTNNRQDVSFVVEILANQGRAYDLNVTGCNISFNGGKGIYIEGQRSGILINSSDLLENGHLAGLDISSGSGDIIVNNSFITNNNGDGINITYSGGFIHIDRTSIANNIGRGISFWFNETSNHVAFNHTVHITASEVVNNSLYGILVGNQCMSNSFWNISLNAFRDNRNSGILLASCWSIEKDTAQSTIMVTHNQFLQSDHLSLEVSPILHMHLLVEHNEFKEHNRGVLFINGLDDDDYANVPAKAEIQYNHFLLNFGKFVANIGVCQGTSVQEILFYRNELERNSVKEPFPSLNPRSRVAAVVVVSSQNTRIIRNRFENSESLYELGSHIEEHNVVINATYNYWGYLQVRKVYERIFDRKDRYNLATVEFLPFLTISSDLDSTTAVSDNHERDKIIPFQSGLEIGGEVPGSIILPKDTYIVKRDIYVRPGNGRLQIESGSTLKFDQSIGMMVQGVLLSESLNNMPPVTYTINDQTHWVKEETNIRLLGPSEGLLEVFMDGRWGSVCDYGWDIVDASIACNQMGLVLHPEDWLLEQSEFDHSSKFPILVSNLQCTIQDTDITKCKSETDFENSCFTKVGLRCYQPTWSGLRLGMAAKESRLKNIVIEHAGLLDYATNSFKPALQVDFNKHFLEKLRIKDNTDSGIGIMWNEMFVPDSRKIIDSQIHSNRRHGIVVRSQGLKIHNCDLEQNGGSGILYNPMFSKMEQRDLISWINLDEQKRVLRIPDDLNGNISLNHNEYRYLIFTKSNAQKRFSVTTTSGRSIGIVVLNPFGQASSEKMTIYGRLEISPDVTHWNLRENLTAFPLQTPGYGMLVEYSSGQNPSGQGIIYIASVDGQRDKEPWEIHPMIHIDSVKINECKRGISSHHYNRDVSEQDDHFHRYTNETILITDSTITRSKAEAIFVWTPFWDPVIKNLAEINYTMINNTVESNAKGLLHYSRDIRNSNNLFHWTINNTDFENNGGGLDIRLPYVWQYNENFTHSFSMHNCSLKNNRKFVFSIDGHFAQVNISNNRFEQNVCKKGIMSFSGMEKELLIEDNFISENSAHFGVEFNLQSHANRFGLVPAYFRRNVVTNNRDVGTDRKYGYHPTSYGLAIRGVQLVNINRNILENRNMQFELLTGVLTGSIDNRINVGYNWWGSEDPVRIQERIFDFDDWNGYAIADINPYLGEANINAGALPFDNNEEALIKIGRLGGRLYQNYKLKYRNEPYVITSDLTVMPGSTLTIEPGVVLEFQPSVGILVLGDIVARGTANNPIRMKPTRAFEENRFDEIHRPIKSPVSRFCIDEKCNMDRSDGFLEIYNTTTQQWVPLCDARFTERNAQVVCKELGYNVLNVHLYFGPRLEMGPTLTSRVRSWPHPLECVGTESSLADCEYRLNGYVDSYKCNHDGDFVYVYCGPETLPKDEEHWGGIRFSIASFETTDTYLSRPTLSYSVRDSSVLEYVHISGAGVLHNEKSPAVQLVQREVVMDFSNITESASHGLEVIGVSGSLSFNELKIFNNLGIGINVLSLTGESTSEPSKLGYDPLQSIDISYGIFGMVDICDTNKEMPIDDRILLYYKYDNQPVDCVKIFNSRHSSKQIGFRLLQFNLFNGTKFSAQPDNIKVYDGDVFNDTSPIIANIGWHVGNESATRFYVSSYDTLSIVLHTIGGSGDHGFVAEIITVPIIHPRTQESVHNISYSEISYNSQEGVAYRSAGEITPAITLRYSRIINNGKELFGNFTTGDSAVSLDLQNAKYLHFYNNLIRQNQGGLSIKVDSRIAPLGLRGMIVNNLFTENRNKEVLSLQGRKSGAFQWITVLHNYFVRNYAQYRNTILVSQVISNLTENMAHNNTGKHVLHVQGFERVPLSYQICVKNWFWRNVATDYWDKSTIIASKAGQKFTYNYLVNPDNDFELAAKNRSVHSNIDSSVYAAWNWWGFHEKTAISGRIKDSRDSEELLSVTYEPFLPDNTTVLSGKCAGGWTKIGDTCFLYVGGVMTFDEAKKFCQLDNATLPYVKTKHAELMDFVKLQQLNYQHYSDRFWIQSLDIPPRECAVLVNRKVVKHPCDQFFPFLCERDPEITVSTSLWFMEPLTIAFLSISGIALVFVTMCVGFWLCKSRQRYREKLERRNSIRASIRSNRSLTGFSELGYKRRMERAFETESIPKTPQLKMNGSLDSVEKSASRFSCSMDDSYENTLGDTSSSRVANGDFSPFVRGYQPDAQHENGTANLMVHPTFDLTYENQCFVDRSASRNSHEISRDWSSSTGSTLDMKRSLDRDTKEQPYHVGPYNPSPSPNLTLESNGGSSRSSNRHPPLETAM